MRRLSLILLTVVTACASGGGSWPSLARRPIESLPDAATTAEPRRCAAARGVASCLPDGAPAAGEAAASPPPTAPIAIDDVPAKLAVIDRDLTDAAERLAAQRRVATAAAQAARETGDGSAWAKAQIELTALDRIGNQVSDLRARLDAIAGTLAAADAGGGDVATPLRTTGRLIARATTLTADYNAAAAALKP